MALAGFFSFIFYFLWWGSFVCRGQSYSQSVSLPSCPFSRRVFPRLSKPPLIYFSALLLWGLPAARYAILRIIGTCQLSIRREFLSRTLQVDGNKNQMNHFLVCFELRLHAELLFYNAAHRKRCEKSNYDRPAETEFNLEEREKRGGLPSVPISTHEGIWD